MVIVQYRAQTVRKELLLTSLVNDKTPFIRYQIGDQGKIIYDHICGCGNSEPIIEHTKDKVRFVL